MKALFAFLARAQSHVQIIVMAVVLFTAFVLTGLSVGAAFGLFPWLEVNAAVGGAPVENAGMIAQIGGTVLFALMALYLPAQARIMSLERSHRDFTVSMEDVARAYRMSHDADRRGMFQTTSEFDQMRERLSYMREHPDLRMLEPEVLELAAQMSHQSRDLAETYSEEKVGRARTFLTQRQEEIDSFQEHLALARKTVDDLRHWMMQLEAEEGIAEKQVAALQADLLDLLPLLGFDLDSGAAEEHIVVPLTNKAREEHARQPSKEY